MCTFKMAENPISHVVSVLKGAIEQIQSRNISQSDNNTSANQLETSPSTAPSSNESFSQAALHNFRLVYWKSVTNAPMHCQCLKMICKFSGQLLSFGVKFYPWGFKILLLTVIEMMEWMIFHTLVWKPPRFIQRRQNSKATQY